MEHSERAVKSTVIDFIQDASFFVERGLRLAHRQKYDKAIRYFQRAVELEPTNADYLYHLANILAETGRFEESNAVLYQILNVAAPEMVDVYFYLANNYAHMEQFHLAEEMAHRYLQLTEDGFYAEEAEELLDYIYFELELAPRPFDDGQASELYFKHEQARKSLEEGRFIEASIYLQQIIDQDDSFIPAWNNLALAYYYMGDFAKAMETIEQTLEREPGNLHTLCNLAVLLSHHQHLGELTPLLQQLKKVVPLHSEHIYKLATTMGALGQHGEAYYLYQRLLRTPFHHGPQIYHYAAISAYYTNRINQAIRLWEKARQLDPQSGVPDYYLQLIQEETALDPLQISYHYNRPDKEGNWEEDEYAYPTELQRDPMVRASLMWALKHGNEEAKEIVIQTLKLFADEEAEATLRNVYDTCTDPHLKQQIREALQEMGVQHEHGPQPGQPHAEQKDSMVLERIKAAFHDQPAKRDWMLSVWSHYLQSGSVLTVRKSEAWLAALEYLYAQNTGSKQTQSSLAEKYQVSVSTIAKCIKQLASLAIHIF